MKPPLPNSSESNVTHVSTSSQATDNRIRALFETVVDGIVVIDSHGLIQTLNPAAITLFGYTEQEVANKNINMLMPQPYA
ncbi:MAG: PAS domain S-box protein, partial [Aquabacterium sp.]|nr:PAS domain S-box protein [Aquabacterium sp.]